MGGKWGDKPAEKTLGEARTQEWDADIKGVHQYHTMYDGQIGLTAFDVARPEVVAKVLPDIRDAKLTWDIFRSMQIIIQVFQVC